MDLPEAVLLNGCVHSWKVAVLGSGNWGATIAKLVGFNTPHHEIFQTEVFMWVFEEMVDGQKLSEIINQEHENVKYLPGVKLPTNVVAEPNLKKVVETSDVLIFVLPFQFVKEVCEEAKNHIKKGAFGISLIKGLDVTKDGVRPISQLISDTVGVEVSTLIGANIADEISRGEFAEATIGSHNPGHGEVFYKLFSQPTFRVNVVRDRMGVELFGALKYVVGVAAGFCDGLHYGDSTKSAIVCIGAREMWKFCQVYFSSVELDTFLENCGLGDLIVATIGGRNRRVAEAFVTTGKPIEVLEAEMLSGQKMQGPRIAKQVHSLLRRDQREQEFPLFTAVYNICHEKYPPQDLLKMIIN